MIFDRRGQMGVLSDPISAVIGLGSSIVSGILGKKTATSASQGQAAAADEAGKLVTDTTASVNPTITAAAKAAGEGVTSAATTAGTNAVNAGKQANLLLDPFAAPGVTAAGQIDAGLKDGSFDTSGIAAAPTIKDIEIDPGYAFREQQGELAQQRLASARGSLLGGGAAKKLEEFAQGNASQEYSNAFARFKANQATRLQAIQQKFQNLFNVSESGRTASTQQGANLIGTNEFAGQNDVDAAKFAGSTNYNAAGVTGQNTIDASKTQADYKTQAANAIAAGKVAGTNAVTGAIGGAANTLIGSRELQQGLRSPSQRINLLQPVS